MDSRTQELTGAKISFDPKFLKGNMVVNPKSKPGYEEARDHGKKANRIAGIAHEAQHAIFAMKPGVAEKLVRREEKDKEGLEVVEKYGMQAYQDWFRKKDKEEYEK